METKMEKIHTHHLQIDVNDLNIIAQALGNMPFKMAAPVIDRLQKQLKEEENVSTT